MRQIILTLVCVLLLTACLQAPPDELDPIESLTAEPTSAIGTDEPPSGTEEPTPTDAPIVTEVPIPTAAEASPMPAEPVIKLGKGAARESSLSPDGQLLVVVSEADTTLYQIEPWQVLWRKSSARDDEGWMWHRTKIGWSADGAQLTIFDEFAEPQVTTYDARTGTALHGFTFPVRPLAVAFSPNGTKVAINVDSYFGPTTIWDVSTGQQIQVIEETFGSGSSIAWSPDGTILASGPSLWDAATGAKIRDFAPGMAEQVGGNFCCYIDSVVISPDGRLAATTAYRIYGSDSVVSIYDMASGAFLSGLHLAQSSTTLAFTADSREVAYTDGDYTIHFVDPYSARETRTMAGAGDLQFHSNGSLIMTPPDSVQILDAQTGALRTKLGGYNWWPENAAYSPDGSLVATTSLTQINLWDAHTGEWKRSFAPAHREAGLSWSPDSRLLAVGGRHPMIWDVQTGQLLHHLDDGIPRPFRHSLVAFSPRGDLIAATAGSFADELYDMEESDQAIDESYWDYGDGDRVHVWDTSGRLVHSFMYEGTVSGLAWSPDGSTLAVRWAHIQFSEDYRDFFPKGTLWNVDTGEQITEWDWQVGVWPRPILWSPDARILASVSGLGLWDAQTGSELYTFDTRSCDGGCYGNLDLFAFNRDGSAIMGFAYNMIHIWSTSTGELQSKELITIAGYPEHANFYGQAVAPDWSQITLTYYNEIFLVPIPSFAP